jgi:hypothetical protein
MEKVCTGHVVYDLSILTLSHLSQVIDDLSDFIIICFDFFLEGNLW